MPKADSKNAEGQALGGEGGGKLVVTDQQSRFHTEASEHSTGKEIIVKDLSIAIGNKEILSHAQLHLQPGRRYVLVGRNGIGKSTLLRAIGTQQISSIPRSIRVLLLGQTQSNLENELSELTVKDQSVLQHVLQSDAKREKLLRQSQILSSALDQSQDPTAVVKAYRKLDLERIEEQLAEAQHIATKRSGARGKRAREVLIETEAAVAAAEARLAQPAAEIDAADVATETQKASELFAEVQTSLELMDAAAAESRARLVLLGLGFSLASIDSPVSQLSGGWKTRCQLACALCQSADVLMLDEPTNYLDLPSIIWLEKYINEELDPATTVIIVTHDRSFVDSTAEELLVLRHQQLEVFRGNLSNYELEKIKNIKWMSRMNEAQEKQKKHMEKSIENNLKAAKRAGDDKKLKQVASRKKKVEERSGLQVSAKGTRFKLNRDLPGYHTKVRADIEIPTFDPPVKLAVPSTPPDLRFPGALVSVEKAGFAYGSGRTKTPIFSDVNLTIHMGERVGIAGLNGAGKSTLVKLIMGSIVPTSGTVTRHSRAKFSMYSQQSVEELEVLVAAQPNTTALTHLMEFAGSSLEEKDARTLLSSLGLQGKTVSDVPVSLLSGGQKVRLALAKVLCSPPHLLILDEVTTHLDADTILALIPALRAYEGAILIITHDRFFMQCVVEGESPKALAKGYRIDDGEDDDDEESSDEDDETKTPGVIYRLSKGKFTKLERGMEQYAKLAAKASSKLGKA